MQDTPVVAFYKGEGRDHRGRSLTNLQDQTLSDLERIHDYIQWLFPLPEPSSWSESAPVLTSEDVLVFKHSPHIRQQVYRSLLTMLDFYGLQDSGGTGPPDVVRGPTFHARATVWLSPSNHNFLRLTRILRCLVILGFRDHARALFTCLVQIYAEYGSVIGGTTLRYWRNAVDERPSR